MSSRIPEEQLNRGATGQTIKVGLLLLLLGSEVVCGKSWSEGGESPAAQVQASWSYTAEPCC